MSYNKTNWQNGDIITAAKMNKVEQGIYDATEGGGTKLYKHNLDFVYDFGAPTKLTVSVLSAKSTAYTLNDFLNHAIDSNPFVFLYGYDEETNPIALFNYTYDGIACIRGTDDLVYMVLHDSMWWDFSDTVIEL